MRKRTWVIAAVLVALAAAGVATRDRWAPQGAVAQAPPSARVIPVETALAVRKPMPVNVDALGTVTPFASVAVKARLETEIVDVHFKDGADVKEGDLLFTLDARALEAQIAQTEGLLARDKAQLEGAERDMRRYTELLARSAGTQVNVDNAKTQADMLRGTVKADEAALRNLRVQLGYTKITAPISGRVGVANVKLGNFVRPADLTPLATINQIKPVYVTFAVPQRWLPDLKAAMGAGSAQVQANVQGQVEPSVGKLAMIENTVDATTGMVLVRAIMNNTDEALWPGSLVNTVLTVRSEEEVAVPAVAVQTSQTGTYVFVIKDGVAKMQPVTVERTSGAEAAIAKGLAGGETVVIDGQMLLSDGTKVSTRAPKVGS
jgi:RND family efflux transporter MFP subunit